MNKKIFAAFLALLMLLQIPAVVDVLDDFGIETTAEAATYKLKKPVITKLTNVSAGVKVQWGKVSGAAKYRVLYKTSASGSWKKAGDTTSTGYTFKNVTSGKTYYFTVRCVSSTGKSYTSAYDKTGEKIRYLAKPVIKKLSNVSRGVKITWGDVPGAVQYRVLRKTSSGWTKVADTTSTSYTYLTSCSGKKYTFTVRCISSTGKSYTSYYYNTGKSITYFKPGGSFSSTSPSTAAYIGNSISCFYHRPSCSLVDAMSEANKVYFAPDFEPVNLGYAPCERCEP